MTCVLAVIDKRGNPHMIGDSLYLTDDSASVLISDTPKVIAFKTFLLGFCGNVGEAQAVVHWFEFHADLFQEDSLYGGDFYKRLKAWMEERRYDAKEMSFDILIASKRNGTIFCTGHDGALLTRRKVWAIGSGSDYALSSWRAMELCPTTPTMTTKAKMHKAMEITEEFTWTVRGPFFYARL